MLHTLMQTIRFFVTLLLILCWSFEELYAQELFFIAPEHDFGRVEELGGPVEHTFLFVNQGEEPVRLISVRASCGCTTPEWTKELVAPGDTGQVLARFDPDNRPGGFRKTLTVTTTNSTESIQLSIKGYVKPKPGAPSQDFPHLQGRLRLAARTVNFGLITDQKVVTQGVEVYNPGADTLYFADKVLKPGHISLELSPIPPQSRAELPISFDPVLLDELGYYSTSIVLHAADSAETTTTLYVMATVQEYFPPMSEEEMAKAPLLIVDKYLKERSGIKIGDTLSVDFVIENAGKQTLNLRKLSSNCTCLTYSIGSQDLEPGEQTTLTLRFNSAGRPGTQQKSISIFSNDPISPIQMVSLKVSVRR